VGLAARVAAGALPRTGIGYESRAGIGHELSSPGWQAGAMRRGGLSPLPVRPLRLGPITAMAGGRACVTPGTGPHQPTVVTHTGHGSAPEPRQFPALQHEAAKVHSGVPGQESHPRR
jgi:hypothetical protein